MEELKEENTLTTYLQLLCLFMDNPDSATSDDISNSPFGIHSIMREAGATLKITPGKWFGPQMISVSLQNINNRVKPVEGFEIHVCLDGNIFLDKILSKLSTGTSLLVLVPLRLGLTSIQQAYHTQIKRIFSFSSSVGIAGGQDCMAYYLVGLDDAGSENIA